jgi:putative FmdB family regulatory protein
VPNYEYECKQCAHRFELWQSVGEDAPPCPKCKSEVKKVFHVPRVIFKGSGFYVTDLRAEKGGNGASAGKPAADASDDKSSSAAASESSKPADAPASESKGSDTKSENSSGSTAATK